MYYSKRESAAMMLNIMRNFSFEIDDKRIAVVTKSVRDIMINNLGVSDASIKYYLLDMIDRGIIRKGGMCEYIIPHDGYTSLVEEEAAQV